MEDIFTLIQNLLAKSFGFALELPGQLILSSKEKRGIPIGFALNKEFELFGLSFSLGAEYTLLKGRLEFDLSVSKLFNILGLQVTPSLTIGKHGFSASLEIGTNNYHAAFGVGFDRVPGFSVGLRRGDTGFNFGIGGGFADELRLFGSGKTFTIPLGIDAKGQNRVVGSVNNSGTNTIDYINSAAGVLNPVRASILSRPLSLSSNPASQSFGSPSSGVSSLAYRVVSMASSALSRSHFSRYNAAFSPTRF